MPSLVARFDATDPLGQDRLDTGSSIVMETIGSVMLGNPGVARMISTTWSILAHGILRHREV